MGRLANHYVARLVVGVSVLNHVGTHVNALECVCLEIVDKEKHQALVVEEMLESFERELVEVVVNADNLHFDQGVVFEQFEHQLWIDETAQVKDQVRNWNLQPLDLVLECCFHIAFKHLREVSCLQLLYPFHLHLVEVLAVELAEVAHQVFVNDLVADTGGLELRKFELDSVLVQNSLRSFLHTD